MKSKFHDMRYERCLVFCLFLFFWLQEKSNQEIDLTYKLKSLQQSLEKEEAEHKATKAKLADKNTIYESIEEAKSAALKGERQKEQK